MDDYISRQIMLDAVDKLKIIPSLDGTGKPTPTEDFRVQFLGTVLKVPAADVVPVVRCENCKYCIASRQGKLFCIHGFEQTIISAFVAIDNPIFERELDSFCSYGERKESAYEI